MRITCKSDRKNKYEDNDKMKKRGILYKSYVYIYKLMIYKFYLAKTKISTTNILF